jgi:cation diffusion facilitator family transporter
LSQISTNNPEIQKRKLILSSFVLSIILMGLKFFTYYLTGSKAILTDAVESIVNVVASGFAFYSIYLSSVPKDENHPYGHGKIEFFSAGLEGALIMIAGVIIFFQSIFNLFNPVEFSNLPEGMIILAFTAIANFAMGIILKVRGKELNSIVLISDGKHIFTDAISSVVLVLGVAIVYLTNIVQLDSILAIGFSIYFLFSGFSLVKKSVIGLMDAAHPETLEEISTILNNHRQTNWIDIHNLRIQRYGANIHVDCHITLPYYYSLVQTHDAVDHVEELLTKNYNHDLEIFLHADPCIPENCCSYCRISDCPVRKAPSSIDIPWTVENLSKNQKHYRA